MICPTCKEREIVDRSYCRECRKVYNNKRYSTEEYKEKKRAIQRSEAYKKTRSVAEKRRRKTLQHQRRLQLTNDLRKELIKREKCLFCDTIGEGHHTDYEKNTIVWLCKTHHKEVHDNKIQVP
jgi:hypothetical protein